MLPTPDHGQTAHRGGRDDMHLTITGRNTDVTPAMKLYAEEKVSKIGKYLHDINSVHVILAVEKYRHIAEITVQSHGLTIKGQEETGDMYSSIDKVMDKIDIQARKLKEKLHDKGKNNLHGSNEGEVTEIETAEEAAEGRHSRISRSSAYDPRPMTVDEAELQLQMRAADRFLVFREAKTEKINVLYRRENGELGLIETD
jgi:putative sigma-54 modulation protein